jgi:hypothetical protein
MRISAVAIMLCALECFLWRLRCMSGGTSGFTRGVAASTNLGLPSGRRHRSQRKLRSTVSSPINGVWFRELRRRRFVEALAQCLPRVQQKAPLVLSGCQGPQPSIKRKIQIAQ